MREIWKYSLPQIYAFFALVVHHRKDAQNYETVAMRVAYHADGKEFSKFMDD